VLPELTCSKQGNVALDGKVSEYVPRALLVAVVVAFKHLALILALAKAIPEATVPPKLEEDGRALDATLLEPLPQPFKTSMVSA
jgi:hypothetical protein